MVAFLRAPRARLFQFKMQQKVKKDEKWFRGCIEQGDASQRQWTASCVWSKKEVSRTLVLDVGARDSRREGIRRVVGDPLLH